ncbi:UNVERIFIED_CONTAM: hypothetical protein GTU68_041393 [Idotea baltica]|nr:hypothetical protein [Idotea baltica]
MERFDELSKAPERAGASTMGLKVAPIEQVKVGLIGLGNRGSSHVRTFSALYPKAKITAICDVRPEKVKKNLDYLQERGQNPDTYENGLEDWKKMVQRDDLDLVIISTPWQDHAPMCIYSMQQGKHVASEVNIALSLEDSWKIVNTAEEMQRHCIMLENACYGDEELWVLNMVNNGVFGTLTYAEAAYIHCLTEGFFTTKYSNKWRIRHHVSTDANLYPTHGLGPVAQYMNLGRGDRMDTLVSMSCKPAVLKEYSKTVENDNEFYDRDDFAHGDMNNSLVKTAAGRTILLQHDVVTPRPYSRINALAGTKAYHEGYPSRLSLAEREGHDWLPDAEYKEMWAKHNHPLWDELKELREASGGHGGMDIVMAYRLINNLNKGAPLDMDVYDAVDWSLVLPLSALSVQLGSAPLKFPDFTRGDWKNKRTLEVLKLT